MKVNDRARHGANVRFRFCAIDGEGSPIKGIVVSCDREEARKALMENYAHLLSLEEVEVQDWRELFALPKNVGASLPVYTRAIATMFEAGLPLASIFEVVATGDNNFLNEVMRDVSKSLREGKSLSNSLSRWRSVFDSIFIGLCAAAEKSGKLHSTLRSLATLLEKRWRISTRMKSAFSYPILVSVVALAIFWVLVAFIVPGLVPAFQSIGAPLPLPTRILVSLGQSSTLFPIILLGLAFGIGVSFLIFRLSVRGDYFPEFYLGLDKVRLRLPLFGSLFKLAILTRCLSTMASILETGMSLLESLDAAGQVSGSPVFQRHFLKVRGVLMEGGSLAAGLEECKDFPPLVVGVAALGEDSGKLPFMMARLAELYEEDLDTHLDTLATLLEPIMLGVLGLGVGFIVLATFLPMISLVSQF